MTLGTLRGKVIRGDGIGRRLGFPTANLDQLPPPELEDGVYAASVTFEGAAHHGMLILGDHHRDGKMEKKVELYLLDFDGDLYGKLLEADIIEKIRPFKHFPSTDALIQRIRKDCDIARNIFSLLPHADT